MRRIIISALCSAALIAGCGPGYVSHGGPLPGTATYPANVWVPPLKDVTEVRLDLGSPPPLQVLPRPLLPASAKGRTAIAQLLSWLHIARRLSPRPSLEPSFGDHVLTVALRGGGTVTVTYDYVCYRGSHTARCHPSSDDVLVSSSASAPAVRYFAPALAQWLKAGWKADMPIAVKMPKPTMPHIPSQILPASTPGVFTLPGESEWNATNGWVGSVGWTTYTVVAGAVPTSNKTGMLAVASTNVKTGQQSLRTYTLQGVPGPLTITSESDGVIYFRAANGATGSFVLATRTYRLVATPDGMRAQAVCSRPPAAILP